MTPYTKKKICQFFNRESLLLKYKYLDEEDLTVICIYQGFFGVHPLDRSFSRYLNSVVFSRERYIDILNKSDEEIDILIIQLRLRGK